MVVPQPLLDEENHILLSSVDETVIQQDADFNLGLHKFKGENYFPKGHKYIRSFESQPIPVLTYRIGGVILTKEILFARSEDRVYIKYTLVQAHSKTKIRIKPYLAFRNIHNVSKANHFADKRYVPVSNGVRMQMYQGYSHLFMQVSKPNEYVHVPDWYYDFEYQQEKERGYDYLEDLYVPGYFEFEIEKGESVYFSAGIEEAVTENFKKSFNNELKKRIPRDNFENCLLNSAQQFIIKNNNKTKIIAGFPWYGRIGRDTFISLPGLCLANNDFKTFKEVISSMIDEMKNSLFPNIGEGLKTDYNTVDTNLWFIWALQQYAEISNTKEKIWKEYGVILKNILNSFKKGEYNNMRMLPNALLFANDAGKALTWMNSVVFGKPLTPRNGLQVEVNALWYNAVMFCLEVAQLAEDDKFIIDWENTANQIKESYKETFWSKDKGYLADYVNGDFKDWSIRPNMVFATSFPYSPLSEKIRQLILELIKRELLTPRGLRTLSPNSPDYKDVYFGDQFNRDIAMHQGTVHPWLLGHFAEGYLKIHGKGGLSLIKSIYENFEPCVKEHGISSISEVYDGNPPHLAGGAPSQAKSVAELLRINWLIKQYENRK